jgi:putative sterol carrier protein
MVKFLSEEWIEHGKNYMLEKLDPEKDLKNLTTSLLGVIEHVPPNDTTMNFYLELQNGKLSDFKVNTGDAFEGKEAIFIIRGNYGTYKDILEGKIGTAMALLKNRLKLKGSKMEALKIIKPLDGMIESLRKITDEFEE